MSVIPISRDAGSFGDEIAKQLSEELGYTLLDHDKIKDLLEDKGIKTPVIEQFEEKTPGFFSKFSEKRERFLNYLSLAVLEECSKGGLVVLGLGGQYMFSSHEALVRVRITAPLAMRTERVADKYECDKTYASKVINNIDNDREGFNQSFFGKDVQDISSYDLVINTEYISIDDSVDFIKKVCRIKDQKSYDFKNDFIRQSAIINILHDKKVPVKNLQVHFDGGILTLEGKVSSSEDRELCYLAAGDIDGVEEIHNKITHKTLNNYSIH
jgi:cytidylate kinase